MNEQDQDDWQCVPTWSLSLSWWPMIAVAWWGYFCFRCSRNASLFLSISDVCIPRISLELRGPPSVCLLGIFRAGLGTWARLCPLDRCSLGRRHAASSRDVTWRLLFPCSARWRTKVQFTIKDFTGVSGLWQLLMNQCNLTEFFCCSFFRRIEKNSTIRSDIKNVLQML